jgi:uncharacterized protein
VKHIRPALQSDPMTWSLTAEDVECIAIGAAILGTGGGGNPYRGKVQALLHLERGYALRVVKLDELPEDALVVPVGGMGAPTIALEKIGRGDEGKLAVEALAAHLGVNVAATVPIEVGGSNSFMPLIAAAQLGLPTVDADGMGRAFPELTMMSFYFDGSSPSPLVMVDALHRTITLERIAPARDVERLARAICVQLGGRAMCANQPMSVRRLRETCIPHTLELAHRIGQNVLEAQSNGDDPIAATCRATDGRVLFRGKVVDVDRRFERGYNFGSLTIAGLDEFQGATARIELQNEFLICRVDGTVAAIVPDLIALVDSNRGLPVTTEVVRYGLRVDVLGIPAPTQLTTEQALQYVGPRAFGYEEEYRPLRCSA